MFSTSGSGPPKGSPDECEGSSDDRWERSKIKVQICLNLLDRLRFKQLFKRNHLRHKRSNSISCWFLMSNLNLRSKKYKVQVQVPQRRTAAAGQKRTSWTTHDYCSSVTNMFGNSWSQSASHLHLHPAGFTPQMLESLPNTANNKNEPGEVFQQRKQKNVLMVLL